MEENRGTQVSNQVQQVCLQFVDEKPSVTRQHCFNVEGCVTIIKKSEFPASFPQFMISTLATDK
jgi:hypothetical protein